MHSEPMGKVGFYSSGNGGGRLSCALEASSSQSSVINYTQNEYWREVLIAAKDNTIWLSQVHHIDSTVYHILCLLHSLQIYIGIFYIHTTHICLKNPKSVNQKSHRYDVDIYLYIVCDAYYYIIFIVACVLIYKYKHV